MNILFTGSSSFTGTWFAKSLNQAGHRIVCPLSGSDSRYSGVRRLRFNLLKPCCQLIPDAPFGSSTFQNLIQKEGPFDLLCHHAADVSNYRSPDFDPHAALRNNTLELPAVLKLLKASGCRAVVLTGSVFEYDEGTGTEPLRAFSPYGLSKALTFQVLRFYCEVAGMPLGKFVIPNPFGPLEEERFTAYLCRSWREGKTPSVKTPDYVRDNIPVDLLAQTYVQFCQRMTSEAVALARLNPSGYVESQGMFAGRVAREIQTRTGWNCGLELPAQAEFNEPLVRTNTDSAFDMVPGWSASAFWDAFADFYCKQTYAAPS